MPISSNHSSSARARAVSDDGTTVVGELTGASGTRAFSWIGGTLSVLDSSDHVATANAVSEDGSLVVGSSTDGLKEGAYWLDGDFETIYYTSTSVANTVSADGWLIAGTCADGFNYACRWTNRLPRGRSADGRRRGPDPAIPWFRNRPPGSSASYAARK